MGIRFTTAGESHGKALTAVLEGVPAGLELSREDVNRELKRRMLGHGRGARMKIESDEIEFLSGVRAGETLGSPIAMLIRNRDWDNWADVMDPEAHEGGGPRRRRLSRPRPGHADLVGVMKYDRTDARDVLERASARETAARVACGAVLRKLLARFGVTIGSHVVELGPIRAENVPVPGDLNEVADRSPVRCLDPEAGEAMVRAIDAARKERDTLGGIAEVIVSGAPIGLGSHVSWDRKLDGRLAQAMMSIPAIKGVELGMGFATARKRGSEVHDEITLDASRSPRRPTNRAGGTEGGMTTGERIVIRVAMKPISTLMRPLDSIELDTGKPAKAQAERSDTTAVPAAAVIAEAMAAVVIADAMLEKFGGDSVGELERNVAAYREHLAARWSGGKTD
jgi:chorismate synthase